MNIVLIKMAIKPCWLGKFVDFIVGNDDSLLVTFLPNAKVNARPGRIKKKN